MKIKNHASVDILRSFFWRKNLSVIHASFLRGGSEIQVIKLKFVPAIQFCVAQSQRWPKPFMKWTLVVIVTLVDYN